MAVAVNRRARRDYEILDTLEVGMVLAGSEVKSLRESKVQLAEAWGGIDGGELWLHGLHVAPYSRSAAAFAPDPDRVRKLLAHRGEIAGLKSRIDRERLTLVPLALYFADGRAKLALALARGRTQADRRQEIARRDADLEARRAMAQGLRRPPIRDQDR